MKNIKTVKKTKTSYIINGTQSIPLDSPKVINIENWLSRGNFLTPEYSEQQLRDIKSSIISSEARKRILSRYPDYKQRNLNGAVSKIQNKEIISLKSGQGNYTPTSDEMDLLRAAKVCQDFIDMIRTRSNELEASLDEMTEEQLSSFDPSEDSNWE